MLLHPVLVLRFTYVGIRENTSVDTRSETNQTVVQGMRRARSAWQQRERDRTTVCGIRVPAWSQNMRRGGANG